MLTNRRRFPASSVRRAPRPGYCRSRSPISEAIVPAAPITVSCSFASLRSGVGISTVTGMVVSFVVRRSNGGDELFGAERRVERCQVRLDVGGTTHLAGDRLLRLEAVAGDGEHDEVVLREAALLDELPRDGDRDATRRLGEDALGPAQQPD